MIIQLQGSTAHNVQDARGRLEALARTWGQEPSETTPMAAENTQGDDKIIDPVSIVALALSIPPAALAVFDLADRIEKRRRAKELIEHAHQAAEHHVTAYMIVETRTIELSTLDPDQLLELLAEEAEGEP